MLPHHLPEPPSLQSSQGQRCEIPTDVRRREGGEGGCEEEQVQLLSEGSSGALRGSGVNRERGREADPTLYWTPRQNTLETLPLFLLTLLISGLRHPRLAVGLGATWLVGRVLYTVGYASGDPARRMQGGLPSSLSYIGLVITATTTVVQFLSEGDWKI